jgi:HD-GYP domain-containing protein (c-di-GMP phosphodiesterase class II)
MPYPKKIDLKKLLMAFSKALDLTSSGIITHHQMVTIASLEMARALGLSGKEKEDLFCSAIIHDIGVSTAKEKLSIMEFDYNAPHHAEIGGMRLMKAPFLASFAETVKHHHDRWDGQTPAGLEGEEIPLNGRIIHLADRLAVLIKRDRSALGQEKELIEQIGQLSGTFFQPMLVDCLKGLILRERFLLDMTTDFMPRIIDDLAPISHIDIDMDGLLGIAHIFAEVIDQKSPYTRKHSQNVTAVAVRLSEKVGLSPAEVRMMEVSGLLHDLGKLSVPDEVLDKRGRLTPEEFNVMKGHTYFTYHILCMVEGCENISKWAAFHHEKLNGNGYPFHLNGEEIPLGSRIMAVSDVFSALSEDRPYRRAMSNGEIVSVMETMAERGDLDMNIVSIVKKDIEEISGIVNKEV